MLKQFFFAITIFFILISCGDLETEIKEKRIISLDIDFQKRSFSRNNSNINASQLNQLNTHLVIAVPAAQSLEKNYLNYLFNSYDASLLNPQNKKVSIEIPINTGIKIFVFLFQNNYSINNLTPYREVEYYGQSEIFHIRTRTNSIQLGISLKSNDNSETEQSNDTISHSLEEITTIGTSSNSNPDYSFKSSTDGVITFGGPCRSETSNAILGNNTITFYPLNNGLYSDCTIQVTDLQGNRSNTLSITTFYVYDTTLLAHYSFDGNLKDISTFNRHLTEEGNNITFSGTNDQNNISGQAAWFNGVNTFAYYDNITLGDNFTIAFWTKPDISAMVNWDSIVSSGNENTGNQIQIDYDNNGHLRFQSTGTSLNLDILNNEWQHFVFTKISNETDSKKISLYKNGELNNSSSPVNTRWDLLKIGLNRGGTRYWKGYIDEFKLYNRPLTGEEIKLLYESY